MKKLARVVAFVVGISAFIGLGTYVYVRTAMHGFSTRAEPSRMEAMMAYYAVCHGNNGDGKTMFGKGMYPKPPDLRDEIQTMSDGEIFYDIENGIRMPGMPAFGGEDSAEASWKLVHFIRHLPKLTTAEELQMEVLNPKVRRNCKREG